MYQMLGPQYRARRIISVIFGPYSAFLLMPELAESQTSLAAWVHERLNTVIKSGFPLDQFTLLSGFGKSIGIPLRSLASPTSYDVARQSHGSCWMKTSGAACGAKWSE